MLTYVINTGVAANYHRYLVLSLVHDFTIVGSGQLSHRDK
jgi:hypothetical protein